MAFCKNCGNNLPEGATFCSQCGTATTDTQAQAQTAQTQDTTKANGLFDMPDSTAEFDATDIQSNKVMAVLSYISLLVLIPIFAAKDSKFARFHATQGFNVALIEVAVWILQAIIGALLGGLAYGAFGLAVTLSGLFSLVFSLINIACGILAIIGIVNAAQGKAKKLPVIGQFDILSKIFK